ncbi:MAG TPA: hypothetical protein VIW07_13105 [Candidatus Udaeobacter sp.]|jgi:hypothetical protein
MKIEFEPRDLWIGLYWKKVSTGKDGLRSCYRWYLCIIPCFPIIWETWHDDP